MSEISLIGKKIGMTREFYKTGISVPVTVLKVEKGRVIQLIDKEKRGYTAVQIGFGKIKNSKLSKSMKGYFAKKNTEARKVLKEFRVKDLDQYKEVLLIFRGGQPYIHEPYEENEKKVVFSKFEFDGESKEFTFEFIEDIV